DGSPVAEAIAPFILAIAGKGVTDESHSPYPAPLGFLAGVRGGLRQGRRAGQVEPRRAAGGPRAEPRGSDGPRWVRLAAAVRGGRVHRESPGTEADRRARAQGEEGRRPRQGPARGRCAP